MSLSYGTVVVSTFSCVVDAFLGVSCSSPMVHFFVSNRGDESTVCVVFVCCCWDKFFSSVSCGISPPNGRATLIVGWFGLVCTQACVCFGWINAATNSSITSFSYVERMNTTNQTGFRRSISPWEKDTSCGDGKPHKQTGRLFVCACGCLVRVNVPSEL